MSLVKDVRNDINSLETLYDHLNTGLFGGRLPTLAVILETQKGMFGFYRHDSFVRRPGTGNGKQGHIILNPVEMQGRKDIEIAAELAHAMVHVKWRMANSTKEVKNQSYHDAQFADFMTEIGLNPVGVDKEGKPTGKTTGQRLTQTIEPGGAFVRAFQKIKEGHTLDDGTKVPGWKLFWQGAPEPVKEVRTNKSGQVKYECKCEGKDAPTFRGRPGMIKIRCGVCGFDFAEVKTDNVQTPEVERKAA